MTPRRRRSDRNDLPVDEPTGADGGRLDGLPFGAEMAEDVLMHMPPDVAGAYHAYPNEVMAATGEMRDRDAHLAENIVLTNATNDVIDLWHDGTAGRGRAAARAARALYEHLVAYYDVTTDRDMADRYLAHQHVTDMQIADRGVGLDLLKGQVLGTERRRLRALAAKARGLRDGAIARYGKGFVNSWGPDLRGRALRHGLDEYYPAYKILSAVVHGTSGGLIGAARTVEGVVVHRIGNDYQLAAMALLEGTRFYREMLLRIADSGEPGAWQAQALADHTTNIINEWPLFRRAALRVDNRAWPTRAPLPSSAALVAFYPDGHRWFMLDIEQRAVIEAVRPDPEPDLTLQRQHAVLYDPADWNGRPFVEVFPGRRVVPAPGAQPQSWDVLLPPGVLKRLGLI